MQLNEEVTFMVKQDKITDGNCRITGFNVPAIYQVKKAVADQISKNDIMLVLLSVPDLIHIQR